MVTLPQQDANLNLSALCLESKPSLPCSAFQTWWSIKDVISYTLQATLPCVQAQKSKNMILWQITIVNVLTSDRTGIIAKIFTINTQTAIKITLKQIVGNRSQKYRRQWSYIHGAIFNTNNPYHSINITLKAPLSKSLICSDFSSPRAVQHLAKT